MRISCVSQEHSYKTQLILTVEDLVDETDNGGQADVVLLDFFKAFDKVSHKRLLLKLDFYGIRGKTKRWIEKLPLQQNPAGGS